MLCVGNSEQRERGVGDNLRRRGQGEGEKTSVFFFKSVFPKNKKLSYRGNQGGTAATGRNMAAMVSSQGKQLWDAARDGKLPEVGALLSKPNSRSFVDWKNPDRVNVPRRLPLSLLLCCVSVNILDYIST